MVEITGTKYQQRNTNNNTTVRTTKKCGLFAITYKLSQFKLEWQEEY